MQTPLQILGLPLNATLHEIRTRYRQLALIHHPDKNQGREAEAQTKFVVIQDAYEQAVEQLTIPSLRSNGASNNDLSAEPMRLYKLQGLTLQIVEEATQFRVKLSTIYERLGFCSSAILSAPFDPLKLTVNRLQRLTSKPLSDTTDVLRESRTLNRCATQNSHQYLEIIVKLQTLYQDLTKRTRKWEKLHKNLDAIISDHFDDGAETPANKQSLIDALQAWEHRCRY